MAQQHGAERAKPAAVPEEEHQADFEAVTDGLIISDLATGRMVEATPRYAGCTATSATG
jgi:hypothetical protein